MAANDPDHCVQGACLDTPGLWRRLGGPTESSRGATRGSSSSSPAGRHRHQPLQPAQVGEQQQEGERAQQRAREGVRRYASLNFPNGPHARRQQQGDGGGSRAWWRRLHPIAAPVLHQSWLCTVYTLKNNVIQAIHRAQRKLSRNMSTSASAAGATSGCAAAQADAVPQIE